MTLGVHFLVEYIGCDAQRLKCVEQVEPALLEAVGRAQAHYLNHSIHQFEPEGVSAVVMIAESHFSIHTWPEHAFAALDIFTCGEMDATAAIDYLTSVFDAAETRTKVINRGF